VAQSWTIVRSVGTSLTRSTPLATLSTLASDALALFQAGGTYDIGADKVHVQWRALGTTTTLEFLIEDEVMSAVSSDLATRASTIRTGLLTLSGITSVDTSNIAPLEQSSPAHVL
jgi:hypothetical protein